MEAQINFLPFSELDEELHSSKSHRKYTRITPDIKENLLKKVLFENVNIKKAATMLKINYSSAKAIISTHKRNVIDQHKANNESQTQ